MWINKVLTALDKAKVNYAIAGGYAVALHGAVRGTVDLDLVLKLSLENFKKAESALNHLGLRSRLPIHAAEVFEFRKEYIERRNLVGWSFYNQSNPAEVIDIIITHDASKMKTVIKIISGQSYRLLDIDELIQMKKESGREQDLQDIKALEKIRS